MDIKPTYNRRRFLSLVAVGTTSLGLGRPSFSSELPKCESGVVVRGGWRAMWDAKEVKIKHDKRSNINGHAPDLKLYLPSESGKFRGKQISIENFLGLTFNYNTSISTKPWIALSTPQFFETKTARYDARHKRDYENDGLYRTPILDGVSGLADVRLTLKRKGTRGLYTKIKGYGYGKFSLDSENLERFFGDGNNPLVIEFSADGRLLFSRKYNVNGILRSYSESKQKHFSEKLRKEKKICDPGCFLTTAACGYIGLDDACWELTTLRKLRDTYLAKTQYGRAQIKEYYAIAPKIVKGIDAKNNSAFLYLLMYWKFILPSALLAKIGCSNLAHTLYCSLVKWAKKVSA